MNYTVNEFRASTRKVLDLADTGEEVIIKRYDKTYAVTPIKAAPVVKFGENGAWLPKIDPSYAPDCKRHHVPPADCAHLHG